MIGNNQVNFNQIKQIDLQTNLSFFLSEWCEINYT